MIPKVSIILPVYNAGEKLKPCLDTLINQTLQEIEIIIVLDCPTDGSDKIVEQYAQKDARIKLIYNETNLHIGSSRNEGLKVASGEYIGFSDHDDERDIDMYKKLYLKAKTEDADIVISNYMNIDERRKKKIIFNFEKYFGEESWDPLRKATIYLAWDITRIRGVVWNQLYKRDFLLSKNILFPDTKKICSEDRCFLIQCYFYTSKISYIPAVFYTHNTNTGNNTCNSYAYHNLNMSIGYLNFVHNFLLSNNLYNQYKIVFSLSSVNVLYTGFRGELSHGIKFACKAVISIRQNIFLQDLLSVIRNKKYHKELHSLPFTKQIFYWGVLKRKSQTN